MPGLVDPRVVERVCDSAVAKADSYGIKTITPIDSTNFTTLFGGTGSLKNFWHNLATMK